MITQLNLPLFVQNRRIPFMRNNKSNNYLVFESKKAPARRAKAFVLWLQQDSNLYLRFRKPLFYPLNYGAVFAGTNLV